MSGALTALPLIVTPGASARIGGGSSVSPAYGTWSELTTGFVAAQALRALVVDGASVRIQIGVGAAGSESAIATFVLSGGTTGRTYTRLLPTAITGIPASTRVAVRQSGSTVRTVAIETQAIDFDNIADAGSAPAVVAPDDNFGVTVTPNSTAWANSSWVEISASLTGSLYGLMVRPNGTVKHECEIELGTGAAGSEVVLATVREYLQQTSWQNGLVMFSALLPVSAVRLAVRLRKGNTNTNTWSVSALYFDTFVPTAGAPVTGGIQAEGLFIGESSYMRQITKDSTDQSVVVRILDATSGLPVTTVTSASAGLDLQYRRDGADAVALTESDLSALDDAHTDGGMIHIGSGYYRVDLPDAAVATDDGGSPPQTADGVLVFGECDDMVVIGCYVELVENKLDAAGLNALADALLIRATSNVTEGDAPPNSLYGGIAKLTHKVASAAGTMTVYQSDGTTPAYTQTETTDSAADPLTGLTGAA